MEASTAPPKAFASATELVALLRRRAVSSRELLDSYLHRIARIALNAVVTVDAERALAQADVADAAAARGAWLGPLHGLPVTVKDSLATAGMRTTSGAAQLAAHVPAHDAVAVARLRAAGAIVFGKTNLPTLAMDAQTFNPVFGTTDNPWDPALTPGGSSGGSAAALAAGLTGLELGSDISGSVRTPAHCCGVYAHKPSHGIIPIRGHIPPWPPDDLRNYDLADVGPLARSAGDLMLALDVLAGPDDATAVGWRLQLPPPRHGALRGYRVATWFDDVDGPINDEVRVLLEGAVTALRTAGATVTALASPPTALGPHARMAQRLLQGEICEDLPAPAYARLLEIADRSDAGDASPRVRWARDVTARKREWNEADSQRQHLRRRWAGVFSDHDVVLTPVLPVPAFPHDHRPSDERRIIVNGVARPYWEMLNWPVLANVAYLPATAAPIGHTAAGLPVGMQIIGPYLEDRTAIAFAAHLARLVGGFTPPPVG